MTRKTCTGGRRDPSPAGSSCHFARDVGSNPGHAFTPRIVVGDPHHASQNAVVYGDNAGAMEYLLGTGGIAGAVDLVYVDPPFNTGREFTGRDGQHGYSDIWPSEAAFLLFLRRRLRLLNELLSDHGSFYLHVDCKIGYRVRVLIDRTIGRENFRNEITRVKCNPKNSSRKAYGNQTDVIYFYSRPNAIWNDCREPLTEEQVAAQYEKVEAGTGRRYTTSPLYGPGTVKNGATGMPWRGLMPPDGSHWARPPAELEALDAAGRIHWSSTGNPRRKVYADETLGNRIQDIWELKDRGGGRDRYPTEKNLELLERIVLQSCEPGSIVLDCFMGSGTTLVAAAKHGRRFVGIDQSASSLAATLHRLTRETDASFSVVAAAPIVREAEAPGLQIIEEYGGQIELAFPRTGAAPSPPSAVLLGRRDAQGVWQATPLREDRSISFRGERSSEHTHLLTVDPDGTVNASTLPNQRCERRRGTPRDHRQRLVGSVR